MASEGTGPSEAIPRQGGTATELDASAFRLLVDRVSDYAIFMLDPDGRIASWNTGAARMKGYAASEIIGQHFSVFYPPDAIARDWPGQELVMATRDGRFEDEGWRLRKDGTRFWANVVITAIRDASDTLVGFGKVTRDISERRAQEERVQRLTEELQRRVTELAATNRELARKSAENESFVYSVSHDLRSPLVNLQGFSQELDLASGALRELLADPAVPEPVRSRALELLDGELPESIGYIRSAVQHLGNIIDGLLRLSRTGRVEYVFEPVAVGAIVRDILASMHTSITASGTRVEVGALPEVLGDRHAIGQIFANLIDNAVKALQPGRPGHIEIGASSDDPPVFHVRDNGVGIPAAFRSRLFQVFQQVHERGVRGEGMGLAIVRRIVERHDGRIWCESTAGEGTTFFFVLAAREDAGGLPLAGDPA